MDVQKIINYWKEGSKYDLQVAKDLYEKRHFTQSLFFCHLSLEKYLKSKVVEKTKTHAPYIHKLLRLCEIADIQLSSEEMEILEDLNNYNIEGRYPEDIEKTQKDSTHRISQNYLNFTSKYINNE